MDGPLERLKKIAKAVRRPKTPKVPRTLGGKHSLEQLVAITRRKSLALEERVPRSEVLMRRNEILYRLDPLVWAGVNKITRLTASPRVYFTGTNEEDTVVMEMFLDQIGLRTILPFLIKDIFIYGYGVAEIVRDANKKISRLAQIDPKTFDYIRIEGTEYIDRNADGSIKGYRQEIPGQEAKTFEPQDVIIVKFYVLGEECLGLSPLEAVYKTAWIKLNLEEAIGEAVYRHGYPLYWYKVGTPEALAAGFEVTPEKIKEAQEYLKDMASANEVILPWWISPGRVDAKSQIGDLSDFLQYLSAEIMAGMEVPKVYGTTTAEIQGNVAQETLDFEKTIKTMQEIISQQLDEQLFKQYREEVKIQFPYPVLTFIEASEETKMFRARRLAQYSKYHMLTPDINLENEIRKIEGISPRKKPKKKEACVFGFGECPVRKTVSGVDLDKLAKFCASCFKKQGRPSVMPEDEEEGKEVRSDGENEAV